MAKFTSDHWFLKRLQTLLRQELARVKPPTFTLFRAYLTDGFIFTLTGSDSSQ